MGRETRRGRQAGRAAPWEDPTGRAAPVLENPRNRETPVRMGEPGQLGTAAPGSHFPWGWRDGQGSSRPSAPCVRRPTADMQHNFGLT